MGSHTTAPPQKAGGKLSRDTKKRLEARTQRDSAPRGQVRPVRGPGHHLMRKRPVSGRRPAFSHL